MVASLKFYTDSKKSTEAKANLSNAKVIVYKDAGNNKYILDASGIAGLTKIDDIAFNQLKDLKLQYEDNKGISNDVQGLSGIVSKSIDVLDMLFTPIMAAKTDSETAKTGTEAAKTDAEKAKDDANTTFVKAVDLGTKAVAEKVLDAKDGNKLVLVGTLGKFLSSSDKAKYDGTNSQTAKEFLGDKGLKGEKGEDGKSPLASHIAADPVLQNHVAKINIESPEFKRAVQEEMSQPHFDIPESNDAALNWTW